MSSNYLQQVTAVIDTTSTFGTTLKQLKDNVTTLQGQMSTLLSDAPETLDTLNEIAAAIGDDPTFFSSMSTANTTLQTNIDNLTAAASAARVALQTLLQGNIDGVATDLTTETTARGVAIAALQADVNQNESDSDAAIAALQLDVNQNEADADAAIASEITARTNADTALSGRLDTLEADPTTKAYVDAQVTTLVDAAPGALDTLNELAAALGDDANFATTITNSIAAVQADVDQNESDADTAIANLSTNLNNEGAARLLADTALQADIDQNEADADAAIALRAPIANPAFTGQHVTHTAGDEQPTTHSIIGGFPDLILKTNQGDFATHQNEGRILWDDAGGGSHGAIKMKQSTGQTMDFFVGGVTASDKVMSIASNSVDVESLKINGTAVTSTAAELNQLDGITLGTAATADGGDFATAAQGTKADSALQAHQDISGKANLSGANFTGNIAVAKSYPDIELKAGDEKRILFSDAGGSATAGLKHVSTNLDFYVGGIGGSNKEFSVTADGIVVTNGVTLTNGLTDAANDGAAASAGIAVGQLYRNGSVVMIRVS